jgi:2-phospho-L-lactate guanylyltransferase
LGDNVSVPVMAVVPMKPFSESKLRLSDVLGAVAREDLSRRLLVRTLALLMRVHAVDRCAVVSRDEQVLKTARKHGAWSMYETGNGLNQALEQAVRVAIANGVQAVLIVPADLPNLVESDVESVIELGRNPPAVVIAPARRDHGTNMLMVNPPGLINFAFGEMSFEKHERLAIRAGARVEIYRSESVAFDLDVPEDVAAMGEWES